ncbi:hypothetical protein KUA24_85 [Vibrio phage HNL01]|nr:hypothetical protein KUA24_85 [Vibrio phage HNL01]
MNYTNIIVSEPIPFDRPYVLDIGGVGDSYFVSAVEYTPTFNPLKLPETLPVPLTPKTSVHIVQERQGLAASINEGEDLVITVGMSEASTENTVIRVELVHGVYDKLPETVWQDEDYALGVEGFNWIDTITTDSVDADFHAASIEDLIPAGDTVKQITFAAPPVPDEVPTGKFKIFEVKITQVVTNDTNVMINTNRDSGAVVVNDTDAFPKWEGDIEVWCRTHKLTHLERVIDPDTSAVSKFTFGWEANADGTLSDDSTLSSVQIDDIPVEQLVFRPSLDDTGLVVAPVDIENVDAPADLSLNLPFYRIVCYTGRRQ